MDVVDQQPTTPAPSPDSEDDDTPLAIKLKTQNGGNAPAGPATVPPAHSPWKRKQLVDVNPHGSLDLSKLSMRRNSSYGKLPSEAPEAKVLVIYTGGTIGMMRNEKNGKGMGVAQISIQRW